MNRLTKILLIIAGIVVLAGLLAGAYFLGKSKSCPTTTTASPDTIKKSADITQDPNGPYYHKIYAATSKDGLSWQKQDKVLFNHASVPGVVIKDGVIYLYFVDASDSASDQPSVGISKDLSQTFVKQTIKIKGATSPAVDPNPVLLDNGQIRLYYFANPVSASGDPAKASGPHQIMSAQSSDGINFENPQPAFAEENITDPDVFKTAKDWRLFVSKGTALDLAISNDNGLTFQKQNDFSWSEGGVPSTFNFNGTFRTYFCGKGGIGSATGADTGKLTVESGIRVEESNKIVCDPSVIQLPDGTHMMFYKVQEMSQNSNNDSQKSLP